MLLTAPGGDHQTLLLCHDRIILTTLTHSSHSSLSSLTTNISSLSSLISSSNTCSTFPETFFSGNYENYIMQIEGQTPAKFIIYFFFYKTYLVQKKIVFDIICWWYCSCKKICFGFITPINNDLRFSLFSSTASAQSTPAPANILFRFLQSLQFY